MGTTTRDDPAWQTAWSWLEREHEQPLSVSELSALAAWLQADPAHRAAYEGAARLRLLASLVPTVHVPPDGAGPSSSMPSDE